MKTSKLTGAALDWAVAKCEGWIAPICKNPGWAVPLYVATNDTGLFTYTPSTDWAQGGPIIEREKICPCPSNTAAGSPWSATDLTGHITHFGPTPQIAAMRCYVASKLGDTVDVPEELTK